MCLTCALSISLALHLSLFAHSAASSSSIRLRTITNCFTLSDNTTFTIANITKNSTSLFVSFPSPSMCWPPPTMPRPGINYRSTWCVSKQDRVWGNACAEGWIGDRGGRVQQRSRGGRGFLGSRCVATHTLLYNSPPPSLLNHVLPSPLHWEL